MSKEQNLYTVLGIPPDATPEEVRRAYREAALRLHPDHNVKVGETELFLDIQKAYEIISDPQKRARYDTSLPPDTDIPAPVTMSIQYSRNTIPRIEEPQLVYVIVQLAAKSNLTIEQSPPLNVCLVLDSSTSMQGPYMDTVKATAIDLIRQLRPKDSLSLVSFNDIAKVLVPAGISMDRGSIETGIRMLRTGGGTEILKGLQAGFSETRRNTHPDAINHIILLTDGCTYGDEPGCLEIAEQAAREGISISTIGIGSKWNDAFLDSLASRTGGSSMFVSEPKDIRNFLKRKFYGFGKSFAESVTYKFESGPNVTLKYAFRLEPESVPLENTSPVQMGYIPFEASMVIVLEFFVERASTQADNIILSNGSLSLNIPSQSVPSYLVRLKLERPIGDPLQSEMPPAAVVQALSRLNLYRMQDSIQKDMAAGRVKEATHRMQYLATNLLSQGQHDLARTVMAEADRIQNNLGISEEGKKRIKYGTRSLIQPASPISTGPDLFKGGNR